MTKPAANGFTLIEVLVSMLIFLVVSATMATAFTSHMKRNTESEVRSGAIAAAQLQLDELRLVDPPTMPTSGYVNSNKTVGGRNFSLKTFYCSNPTYCISANTRHIKVRVIYAHKTVLETETVYTRLR